MKFRGFVITIFSSLLFGCATPYQSGSGSITGGHYVKQMEGNIYRVSFHGNGHTTKETVQTYWLYRCAELALEKGFEGFEIISHMTLSQKYDASELINTSTPYKRAQVYFVPMNSAPKPEISADIMLLKKPFEELPPKVFNAQDLLLDLAPFVEVEKRCAKGNVCEHVHKYLHPRDKFVESI